MMESLRTRTVGTGGDVTYAPIGQGRTEQAARAHPIKGRSYRKDSPWLGDAVRISLSRTAMRMLRWLRGQSEPALSHKPHPSVATYGRDGKTRPMVDAQFPLHEEGRPQEFKNSPWSTSAGGVSMSKRGRVVYGVLKHMQASKGDQSRFLAAMRENRRAGRLNEADLQAARDTLGDWMEAEDTP
ncbi:hypothetical protein [Magnetococcus sp. PR-3]|uniref:hypothetical protein n=1 Tax=Magnetococcus sp. PR-3 TaxID=3120355 RepID=UPI002FCE0394